MTQDATDFMSSPVQSMATLVFPAVDQTAADYVRAARDRGERVVCAASVSGELGAAEWGPVHHLPLIYDEAFPETFRALVATHSVGRVLCPVASVHAFMRRFLAAHHPGLAVIGDSPIRRQVREHRELMARARRLLPLIGQCFDGGDALSPVEVAGVLRQASLIYGESNDEKLAALMGVAASAPEGDVVEIGSQSGRSAFVLLYLAARYRIGPVLTVDPWTPGDSIQHDSPVSLHALADEWDYDALSEGFFVHLVPSRADDHAHLRMPSVDAFAVYAGGEPIFSPRGAPTGYSGAIGLIHIDGNHDYGFVSQDCDLWLSRLAPGAWVVLDDYVWAHGDGPKRTGDELLAARGDDIDRAFVCGKALFLRFRR